MRLNWFSPLAPQRTGIADYTGSIAPALMEQFEVVFWSDLETDPGLLPPGAQVERFDPAHIHGPDFNRRLFIGCNIYNFGNDSRFHGGIARVARQIPGIAILHDTRLHHFAFECSREDTPTFASYLAQAEDIYGQDGVDVARQVIAAQGACIDDHVEAMPFIEPYLEASLGAICHSQAARDQIRACSAAPILTLPLPFASLDAPAAVARTFEPPWRFVMFGYLNTNRRLESILQALATWPQAPPFQFDIYGSVWNPALVDELIQRWGLQDRVTVHGFVPQAQLQQAIAGAHLAFALRHPTMGEASWGILGSWSHATPALVTDEGWYSDLPSETAWKISVQNEAADLHAALNALASDPQVFVRMGRAAQARLAALHSPQGYARSLATALEDLPALTERFAARSLLGRMGANGRTEAERALLLDRACRNIPGLFERP